MINSSEATAKSLLMLWLAVLLLFAQSGIEGGRDAFFSCRPKLKRDNLAKLLKLKS